MPLPHGGHAPEATSRIEHNAVAEAKRVELLGFTGTEFVTVKVNASGDVSVTAAGGFFGVQSVPTLFAVVNTAAGAGGGGTQYPWGGGATLGALGNLALAYRNDGLAITPVPADQQFTPLSADSVGRLRVNPSYSVAESGTHVVGSTPSILNCIAGVRHDADTALTDATDEHAVFLFNDLQYLKVSDQGNVGHDDVDSGRPVKIGGRARTAAPAAVANNDRVDAYFDDTGHLHTKVDAASVPTLFSITSITGVVQVSVPTLMASVFGNIAHDAVDSGNPLKIGMRALAHGTNPTAVAAADRTDWYANRHGIPWVMGGHPNVQTQRSLFTAAQSATALVSAGAGAKLVVTRLSALLDRACTVDVAVRIGFGANSTPSLTGIVLAHPGIAAGSGVIEGNGAGILGIGADGEDLRLDCEVPTGGSLDIVTSFYSVES